jgi:antitoxin component of MazEF toxin-antitoxin module
MISTIKNIKDKYAIELPKDILSKLKVKDTDDVEVSIIDNSLVINNMKIKELSALERLNIRSIQNNFTKLDWGEV